MSPINLVSGSNSSTNYLFRKPSPMSAFWVLLPVCLFVNVCHQKSHKVQEGRLQLVGFVVKL